MPTPHLDYFRRDKKIINFRVRRDGQFWNANRAILSRFGKSLKWNQDRREFNLPAKTSIMMNLASIFPEEWAIITDSKVDEITFEVEEKT